MKLTRDSLILWFGLIGGIITTLAASADLFPPEWKGYIQVAASIIASISGWLKTSPLPGAKDIGPISIKREW